MALTLQAKHAIPAVLALAVHREEDLNVECEEAVRVVVRARARPDERAHHAGGLPIVGVRGQVQLRGRAGVGARVATIQFNKELKAQFDAFYARPDTFSLGICNGCQLMVQLNFVSWKGIEEAKQPRFIQNKYERARGEIERDHAAGHGGLHAGRVGGARRGPLLLARR
ncbi:hypothetical protein BLSTO_04181 [Blastocystis sp. subtype 1]